MQWVDALSPSNFLALNPDAQQSIVESAGRALTEGVANLLGDVKKGRITQTDESQFEIGRNVAVTPSEVVFENRLIQLIQYAPDRDRARASAGDRAAEHQQVLHPGPAAREFFVRHAVEQGYTVFLVSWRNPVSSDTDGIDRATWSDYLDDAVLQALRGQRHHQAAQGQRPGLLRGGTMLASALAWPRRAASTRWPRSRC